MPRNHSAYPDSFTSEDSLWTIGVGQDSEWEDEEASPGTGVYLSDRSVSSADSELGARGYRKERQPRSRLPLHGAVGRRS